MSGSSPSYRAGADIAPSVFVKITGDDTVETAGAAEQAIGVMHESSWHTPIPGMSGDVAVIAGQSKRVYGEDEICEVKTGAAIAAGDKLAPDATGHAVVAGATAAYSAIALSGAASGGRCKCVVTKGKT